MAIFRCHHCDQYIDIDYQSDCCTDPDDDREMICEECNWKWQEKMDNKERTPDELKRFGDFMKKYYREGEEIDNE